MTKFLLAFAFVAACFISYNIGYDRGWNEYEEVNGAKRGKLILYNGSPLPYGDPRCGIFYIAGFDVAWLPYGPLNLPEWEEEMPFIIRVEHMNFHAQNLMQPVR